MHVVRTLGDGSVRAPATRACTTSGWARQLTPSRREAAQSRASESGASPQHGCPAARLIVGFARGDHRQGRGARALDRSSVEADRHHRRGRGLRANNRRRRGRQRYTPGVNDNRRRGCCAVGMVDWRAVEPAGLNDRCGRLRQRHGRLVGMGHVRRNRTRRCHGHCRRRGRQLDLGYRIDRRLAPDLGRGHDHREPVHGRRAHRRLALDLGGYRAGTAVGVAGYSSIGWFGGSGITPGERCWAGSAGSGMPGSGARAPAECSFSRAAPPRSPSRAPGAGHRYPTPRACRTRGSCRRSH